MNDTFKPTEVWAPDSEGFEYGEAIEHARQDMNNKNPDQLIHTLKEQVKRSDNGIVYAVLKGEHPQEYSDSDALVMFNPFANTATANMLVRAEFIREAARQANISDGQGKLKPVVLLAAPGLFGSKLKLDPPEKKKVRAGDFGPAAKEYLWAVSALDYGRVALFGYSQGADLALAGTAVAESANLDANNLSVGDPAGVMDRHLNTLAQDFFKAAPDLESRAARTKLAALDEARGIRSDYASFLASTIYPNNWYLLAKGMGENSFESKMQEVIDDGALDSIVVAYGGKSTITPPSSIDPALARLHAQINDERLTSIKVAGGTHAWGEELTILAKLYLRALT